MGKFSKTNSPKLSHIPKYMIPFDNIFTFYKFYQASEVLNLWEEEIHIIPFEPTSEKCTIEHLNQFIGSQIPIDTTNGLVPVKFIARECDPSGKLIGSKHIDPILDTRSFTIKILDGHFEECSCNVISDTLATGIDKDEDVSMFNKDFCRSISFNAK